MEKYKEIVEKVSSKGDKSDMELLACMIGELFGQVCKRKMVCQKKELDFVKILFI